MAQLRIGELAKKLDCTVETLRFYEREGLLAATGRSANGYRFYNTASIKQLEFILRAKSMGFSLDDIRELLAIRVDPEAKSRGEVKGIAQEKLAQVERKLSELKSIRDALSRVVEACCGGDVPANHCSILQALDDELSAQQEQHA